MNQTVNKQPPQRSTGRIARFAPGRANLLHYARSCRRGDSTAGVFVTAVALPISAAHAEIVGVPTEVGLCSAIFPFFVHAMFGSSRHLMVFPGAALELGNNFARCWPAA